MKRAIRRRPADALSYRRALWTLWLGTVAVISDIYIAQPILPLLGAEFMVSPPVASLAVSFTIFSLSCSLLICGPLSDLVGRKPVMVLSSFLLTVPTALIAFATDFNAFLFFRSLQGLFVAGIAAIAMAYIAEEFPPSLVGRGMGIYVSSMIGAGFFGRVFGGVLSGELGWRTAFLIFSVLNLAGGILMVRYLPPSSRFRGRGGVLESLAGLCRHLGNRRLLGVFIIAFMLFFTFTGAFTYVTFHLSAPPYSLSTTSLGLLFCIYIAGVVSPVAGSLSSRYGRTPVICAGLITASGGILLTFLPHLWIIIGGLFLLCAGLFMSQPAASALVGDLAHEGKGSASSLYLFFYYAGGGVGAIVPGLLWHSRGWPGVAAICLLSIAAAFVSLFTLCQNRQ